MGKTPTHDAVVAKSNSLIPKMAKFDLSELRLIAYCIAHYDSRAPENRVFRARVDDLTKLFPMDKKCAYAVVRKTMNGINKKPLEFKREDGGECCWYWFSGFVYFPNKGEFEFHITPEIQPYLLELKGTFTQYRLKDVYQFKAASTWKMYELLKRWETAREWAVSLDELRLLLGVAGKYPIWKDFNGWVIAPATKEINETSDLSVSYEKEKRGRSVIGVVFFIDDKQPEDVITIEHPKQAVYRLLLDCSVNVTTAATYADKIESYGKTPLMVDLIPKIKERWEKTHKKNNVPLQKYLVGAIKKDLEEPELPFGERNKTEKKPQPEHAEALDCWKEKHHQGEKCPVRERGEAGQRGKCRLCLEKISVTDFGI